MNQNNIEKITNSYLCTGCGGCGFICRQKAISVIENLSGYLIACIDHAKCNNCGLCLKVCPQNNYSFCNSIGDFFIGNVIDTYIGYASDNIIRKLGQSGGVVTSLLCYLLDSQKIEAAIINKFDPNTSNTSVIFTSNREELIASAGSYYVQSAVLEKINSLNKTAIVTLGCQSQALKNINNLGYGTPEYIIGLICAGNYSRDYISAIAKERDKIKSITEFRFRDKRTNGWPGNIFIKYKDNKTVILPAKHRHKLKQVYECHHCLACFDQMNIMADIVVGDPWGINLDDKEKNDGVSVIIIRTNKGAELINNAIEKGYIITTKIKSDIIFKGQTVETRQKNKIYAAKLWMKKNKYIYPGILDKFELKHIPIKLKFDIYQRLRYTRKILNIKKRKYINLYRNLYYCFLNILKVINLIS